ncbi:hypothetical protein [Streptomyces sp. G7(2002)]|uniref:hypothetical protein n=1 Tax=Streptomyces sp. G7(2002) TaxID=2971798 RepID=UPI00237E4BA6|nr:hypothetical protein [Streptomyces sp. G7(2002)]WDT55779.1 hypothetical protein NUT86_17865 [Streptomyces sp. G7(2002)]
MDHVQPQQLTDLDVSDEIFIGAMDLGAADVRQCTRFDAPAMPGMMFWSRVNRYIAEQLTDPKRTSPRPHWKRTQRDSILRVVHPTGSHAITAISAAGGVGDLTKRVRSKNPKGRAMAALVKANAQLAFMSRDELEFGAELDTMPLWCLLYKRSETGVLQAELSLPVKMNGKHVDEWRVRFPIHMPPLDPGVDVTLRDAPGDDEGHQVLVEFVGE